MIELAHSLNVWGTRLSRRSLLCNSAVSAAGWLLCSAAKLSDKGKVARWSFCDAASLTQDSVSQIHDAIYSRCRQTSLGRGLSDGALRLDGYSTWLRRDAALAPKLQRELSIQVVTALESYPLSDAAFINQRNGDAGGYFFGIDPFGFLRFEVSIDGVWRECVSKQPVPRFEWTHLAGTLNASGLMVLYRNGSVIASTEGRAGNVRLASTVDLLIGKTDGCPNTAKLFSSGVINGLLDELAIYDKCLSAVEIRNTLPSGIKRAVPDLALPVEGDPHRPVYHAMPARAWTNEPHGLIHFGGEYHLFYQKNANGPYWGHINWGHLTSPDLLQWADQRPVLSPEPGLDAAGCWSGSVTKYGEQLAIIYTAGDGHKPSICLATSPDGYSFTKSEHNPIIATSPAELKRPDFRDPFVWSEQDTFYLIIGSGIPDVGGTALLYKSSNLLHWTFVRKLLQGTKQDSGTFWEMPVFFPLAKKHVLIVCEVPGRASYWIGDWKNEEFLPDQAAPRRLEIVNHFLSPTPYRDAKGRMIAIGISPDTRNPREVWKAGWTHCYSLPRVLSLDESGELRQEPLPELERLRSDHFHLSGGHVFPDAVAALAGPRGRALAIRAEFSRGEAARTGLRISRSDDGQEETIVYYDWAKQTLTIDRSQSSLNPDVARTVDTGPFAVRPGESLDLYVFLDHSMLDVFVNGRGTLTSRIYPTRKDSDGVAIFCDGSADLRSLDIWRMNHA